MSDLVVGRRHYGKMKGRAVEVTFVAACGITPALPNVTVSVCLDMRMADEQRLPRLDRLDCVHVQSVRPKLTDLYVTAEEGESAHGLLVNPEINGTLARLLSA